MGEWNTGWRRASVGILLAVAAGTVGCGGGASTPTEGQAKPANPAAAKIAEAVAVPVPVVKDITAWQGSTGMDTNAFQASGPAWNLHYKVNSPAGDEFQVAVYRADNGRLNTMAVTARGTAEATVKVAAAPGAYFLRVKATGPWTMDATELAPVKTEEAAAGLPADAAKSATAKVP